MRTLISGVIGIVAAGLLSACGSAEFTGTNARSSAPAVAQDSAVEPDTMEKKQPKPGEQATIAETAPESKIKRAKRRPEFVGFNVFHAPTRHVLAETGHWATKEPGVRLEFSSVDATGRDKQ